ncbi:hypothetical protein CRUP_027708 [Coryphaenoides rupestris]|nr:hypothetical protein CRUP_027708 [Coryphaenoides rupestris]
MSQKALLKRCDQSTAARKRKMETLPSDSEEESDGDMEANFALLTNHSRAQGEEEEGSGGEEEEGSSGEEEEGSSGEEGEGSRGEEGEKKEGSSGEEEEGEAPDAEDDEGGDAEEEEGGGNGHTEEDVKKELSSMSFEEVLKLQQKVGLKVYHQMAHGSTDLRRRRGPRGQKRLNKNRPVEMSSKRSVPLLRQVVSVKKAVRRDPRFDDLSGEYKPDIFEKTYRFINDIRSSEKESVKKLLSTSRRAAKKEELKSLVLRMENQERCRRQQEVQREKELDFKRRQKEQAVQGLQPFYLNKGEQNKLQLAEKYEQLQRSGKLENFLMKKRKRNATKDRRKLPFQNYKRHEPSGTQDYKTHNPQ